MENPNIPQKKPYKIKVEKDKTYFGVHVDCLKINPFATIHTRRKEYLNQLNI